MRTAKAKAGIYIGTSGFAYKGWIGDFYPDTAKKDRLLELYAKTFETVEINSSFYHTPKASTVIKWIEQVPENFIFSLKLSRYITHIQKLDTDRSSLQKFFDPLQPMLSSHRKAFSRPVILIQTPASLPFDNEKLENFLQRLPDGFRYAIEFRNKAWFNDDTNSLLQKNRVALVLSDSPIKGNGNRQWPLADTDITDFNYIRFHGSKKLFTSSYTNEELQHYARLIAEKNKKGMDVYAYFNNDAAGFATKNAIALRKMIGEKSFKRP
jgi:uncharacterized protein YecE (DUF72 family)